jgi:predicted nucleic acid-binding protein
MWNGASRVVTEPVVSNAGPLIHLDETGCLDLLSDFASLLVPDVVWDEVLRHRPRILLPATATLVPSPPSDAKVETLARAFSLDAGETACIALLAMGRGGMFLTDDAAARLAAQEMRVPVHGTVGVLIRSVRRGIGAPREIIRLFEDLPNKSTLFVESSLLEEIKGRLRAEWKI